MQRLKSNMRFTFVMKSQRGLPTINYSHLRMEINFLELIMNRYSLIFINSEII